MDPLCIAGFDGYLKHINPAWERCLGWSEQELLSRPWIELVHSEDREATIHAGRRLARGESVAGFENRYRCRDGSYRWLAWNSISNPEIQTIYASARDVTNVKHLSEQLRQSQKLEAIGRLAGGVAHDFNNLLTVINGYAELLLTSFSAREEHRDSLLAVRDAGERATRLTAQLLAFSRKAIIEPKVLDLNAETQSVIRMLRRLIGEDISISTRLSPNLFR
ncbi:MAG: PAS domain S-box protein, partial [Planctomyces sp.]